MRFGSGNLTYEIVEGWGRIPEGWDLIEVPAVAVDSQDRVFVFSRGEHPVIVFDRDGDFITSWGEGVFTRPHGIFMGPDESVYCVDDFDHTLRKCTLEGKILMTIGVPHQPSDTGFTPGDYLSVQWGGPPFHRPTNVALAADGCLYVTDGYANARVHKFSPEGELLFSWGEPGSGPGQFRLVHGIAIDSEGIVYVGDRMNSRVQLFSPRGEYMAEWNDVYQPNDLFLDENDHLFIGEIGFRANLPMTGPVPAPEDSYSRVTIRNLKGEILSKITSPDPTLPGGLVSPHGIRTDSHGDLYVGQVAASAAKRLGMDRRRLHMLQKYARVR